MHIVFHLLMINLSFLFLVYVAYVSFFTMANNNSYSNDRPTGGVAVGSAAGDLEYATDPASGSFFQKLQDYKK